MGLFSFLKRKNDTELRPELAPPPPGAPPPDTRLRGEPSRLGSEAERARQREIARATAAKIDEIELAFASDIFSDEPAWGSSARHPASSAPAIAANDEQPDPAAVPASAPAVDESAILYANGQLATAEQLLRESLGTLGRHERLPWWMLFDLYQADGREEAFESIAIDYASHFETSPPAWKPLPQAPDRPAVVALAETFDASLGAAVAPRLKRLLDADAPTVRLDFGRVTRIDLDGAACLLAALQTLRAQGRELVLAGADTLMATLRAMLTIGVRQPSQAPWLLLLELLLLTHREKEFEEAAMDYCVTYEVSPPSFEAPRRVSTAPAAPAAGGAGAQGERFMLPATVSAPGSALLEAIDAYAAPRALLVLDCSRLARIDYAGASLLQTRLEAHALAGKRVELRELNHLVAALLRLLGMGRPGAAEEDGAIVLYPHRY